MISIIIVNYNTSQLLQECLLSIFKFTKEIEFEVIVVDNASHDDSVSAVSQRFSMVKILLSKTNIGFGQANNRGAAIASGEFLFFLNSDTVLVDNSVKKLYELFKEYDKNMNIGVLGCILRDGNLEVANSAGHFPTVKKDIITFLYTVLRIQPRRSAYEEIKFSNLFTKVDMVSGADMMIKKAVFDSVGGFDREFFLYYEESDLQNRILKKGFNNYVTNAVSIVHLEGKSLNPSNLKRIIIQKSRNLYFRKNDKKNYIIHVIFEILISPLRMLNPNYTFKENALCIKENLRSL